MPIKEISNGNLKRELEQAEDKLVLVDFFATWCGPCQIVAPVIEKFSNSYSNVVFLKVDVDQCPTETQQYDITAMPTFVFIRRSKELDRIRGGDTQAIERILAKYHKETLIFSGQGYSMIDTNATKLNATISTNESDCHRFEQAVQEHFGNVQEQTMTTLRLRLPDIPNPVNIRLSIDQTLNDIRHLLCETIASFQTTPFEFIVPPTTKLTLDDENKTIGEAKLMNAVINIKKV